MNKGNLTDFIKQYHLNGTVEATKWLITNKTISTSLISEDKTLIGNVTKSDIDIEDGEVGVYITSNLLKILDVFNPDINIKFNKSDTRTVNLDITDKETSAQYMLADLNVIPVAPKPKNIPAFQLKLVIDNVLVNKIKKAKTALPDISHITFNGNNLIVGYSKNNTTNISFDTAAQLDGDIAYKSFNSNYLVDIFNANAGMDSGVIEVSQAGLMKVTYTSKTGSAEYFLVEVNIV